MGDRQGELLEGWLFTVAQIHLPALPELLITYRILI